MEHFASLADYDVSSFWSDFNVRSPHMLDMLITLSSALITLLVHRWSEISAVGSDGTKAVRVHRGAAAGEVLSDISKENPSVSLARQMERQGGGLQQHVK